MPHGKCRLPLLLLAPADVDHSRAVLAVFEGRVDLSKNRLDDGETADDQRLTGLDSGLAPALGLDHELAGEIAGAYILGESALEQTLSFGTRR